MDFLPDEILIKILSDSYDDPFQIFSSLSIVCKRWHLLFKDKHCWTKAELILTDSVDIEVYKQMAVTLLKAPKLLTLTIVCYHEEKYEDVLIKCLQRSLNLNKSIGRIYLKTGSREVLHHVGLFLLQHTLNDLKVLSLKICSWHWPCIKNVGI